MRASQALATVTDADDGQSLRYGRTVAAPLNETTPAGDAYSLRPPRPGDIGWVVQRHGELYWAEYGWDERFEAMVIEIAAHFMRDYDPKRERCWIAERDGERLGCVFVAKGVDDEARLRLLLVEPKARGLGLGKRLVEECVQFSRSRGYRRIVLLTNSLLTTARHLYRQQGFRIVNEELHESFGQTENWELEL